MPEGISALLGAILLNLEKQHVCYTENAPEGVKIALGKEIELTLHLLSYGWMCALLRRIFFQNTKGYFYSPRRFQFFYKKHPTKIRMVRQKDGWHIECVVENGFQQTTANVFFAWSDIVP